MNAIVICLDTLRWDALGCYNPNWVKTPCIDAYAERATLFTEARCGSFPTVPMRVDAYTGDVHWSVVRVDPTHVRVILVDPGYLTPADRNADILLQHLDGTSCVDILSGEILPIDSNRIRVHVPMGIVRIVDITHQ